MRRLQFGLWRPVSAIAVMLIILALGLQGAWQPVAATGEATVIPPPRDFADFLAAQPLVFEGTLVSVDQLTRQRLETCGITGFGTSLVTDLRVAVTRVWQGVADDSTLLVTVLGRPTFSSGPLVPGTRVLVWAYRDCHDGWRLWGHLCVVTSSGIVLGPAGSDREAYALRDRDPSMPTTYAALDSAMGGGLNPMSSMALFEGTSAVALLRLTQIVKRGAEGFTYECDSLGWAAGTGARVPQAIDFPLVPGCYPNIFVGDSLIVPVPSGFEGGRLTIDGCPSAFEVRKDFAVGFGVPVPFLDYALRFDQGQMHVRPFIAKDE